MRVGKESSEVDWLISDTLVPYHEAILFMEERVTAIAYNQANECIWLVEHPPLYTAGTSAKSEDLLEAETFPVFETGRGGQYTYHGPGQRIAYVMLNISKRGRDVRKFIENLETWIITTLARMQIKAERRRDRVGVWVSRPEKPPLPDGQCREDKIAAIGIRLRKWVSFHGISINIDPDLSHYEGIIPCGIDGHGITSLTDLGILISMPEFDLLLREEFETIFGATGSPCQ